VKEGRLEARLAAHDEHFEKINGSIERFAQANENLVAAMRELASEIRSLQEGGRLAQERVKVAAETLAQDTEQRRAALAETATALVASEASSDRKFSKREKLASLAVAVAAVITAIYFSLPHH
jgi:methyl-accepting chemotaxis protein